jgi:FkbM family methyltransferase
VNIAYAVAMLAVVAAVLCTGEPLLLPLPALAAACFCSLLARGAGRVRPADIATSVRLAGALGAGLLAALAPRALGGWAVLGVLAVGEATDWLDGRLARRFGGSAFGAAFDEEADAVFILSVSLVLTVTRDLPSRVAVAGILRYASVPVFALLGPPGPFPRLFSRFAKTSCAAAALLLVAATAPIFGLTWATAMGDLAMGLLSVSFGWEAAIRLSRVPAVARARGVARSLLVYYAVPGKARRTAGLYSSFVGPGSLAFDVGSHVGNRVAALRRLGARVVAVEPDPGMARIIRRLYGKDGKVTVVEAAVGERPGRAVLRRSRAHPTVSSINGDWIDTVSRNPLFRGIMWEETVEVDVVTLDDLIRRFGRPDFCKIDVEGGEAAAVGGLTAPLRALSFEYLPASIDVAIECVARLESLGPYLFNVSSVETMRLDFPTWADAPALLAWLRSLPSTGRSGDVYARLEA